MILKMDAKTICKMSGPLVLNFYAYKMLFCHLDTAITVHDLFLVININFFSFLNFVQLIH